MGGQQQGQGQGNHHHHHHHHHSRSFHLHLPHIGGRREADDGLPPKGWMGIRVGRDGEEPQRFVVPVCYLNHPLFVGLLKEAEEEFGFEQKGAITIPCHVESFRKVQGIIDRDSGLGHHHGHHHHQHQQHHHHHNHLHLAGCFKA